MADIDVMRQHAEYLESYSEPFVGSTDAIARALREGVDRIKWLEAALLRGSDLVAGPEVVQDEASDS